MNAADYTTTDEFEGTVTVTVRGTVRRGQGMRHFGPKALSAMFPMGRM